MTNLKDRPHYRNLIGALLNSCKIKKVTQKVSAKTNEPYLAVSFVDFFGVYRTAMLDRACETSFEDLCNLVESGKETDLFCDINTKFGNITILDVVKY